MNSGAPASAEGCIPATDMAFALASR